MDASDSWSHSDSVTESVRDEDIWDEIVDGDFSDNEHEMSSSEDDNLAVLPAVLSAPPRTVWEILADRLAKSSFEARFVDPEQREANEAAIKKRYQLDPTKRHTWTSRCGLHQVVGYFNLYAHGRVGLFTEEGFPVYVKLNELSAEDVRFVLNKLGHPLRGKVEAQLSAEQSIEYVERLNDSKESLMAQKSSATKAEQGDTNEGQQSLTYKTIRSLRKESPDLEVKNGGERADCDQEAEDRAVDELRRAVNLCKVGRFRQSLKADAIFHNTSARAWEPLDEREVPVLHVGSRLGGKQRATTQVHGSDDQITVHAPSPGGRTRPLPQGARITG
jgi:hypothetical protein